MKIVEKTLMKTIKRMLKSTERLKISLGMAVLKLILCERLKLLKEKFRGVYRGMVGVERLSEASLKKWRSY